MGRNRLMKKYRRGIIVISILILAFTGNYIYGYYEGYNAKYVKFYDKVISPDYRYAIEIQVRGKFWADSSQIIYCEDLITHKKVEYLMIDIGMFNSDNKFDEIFNLEWLGDRALLTVWQDEFKITTYILEWDKIFSY